MCRDCKVTEVRHDGPPPHAGWTGEDSPYVSSQIMARAGREALERGCPTVEARDAFVDHPNGVREVLDAAAYGKPSSVATCGTCGRSWDDDKVSGLTPAPSGRCPFEYEHEER